MYGVNSKHGCWWSVAIAHGRAKQDKDLSNGTYLLIGHQALHHRAKKSPAFVTSGPLPQEPDRLQQCSRTVRPTNPVKPPPPSNSDHRLVCQLACSLEVVEDMAKLWQQWAASKERSWEQVGWLQDWVEL